MIRGARTVGELRKLIEGVDDDVPLIVPASDHSYAIGDARLGTAIFYDVPAAIYEDCGDMNQDDVPDEAIKPALIVRG